MKAISIDAMGGDYGLDVTVEAAVNVLQDFPDVSIIFVGDQVQLAVLLNQQASHLKDRWTIVNATEVVAMDESPSFALRNKKDSSMRVAINLVKDGRAQACVSAGNTGALMAIARYVLKTLPGIDRPAILTQFPSYDDTCVLALDLGANVDSSPEQLLQFAIMGATTAEAINGISEPKVGLLNVGEEEIKGNEQVKKAAELLSQSDLINYFGYVEGTDLFSGRVEVVVCDGFVGNIAVKAVEGIMRLLSANAEKTFLASWVSKLAIMPALPLLKNLKQQMDPRSHNGASLVGLNGTVVKSHGSADVVAFANAIRQAIIEIDNNVPDRIRNKLTAITNTNE